jgi:hypothetical protein
MTFSLSPLVSILYPCYWHRLETIGICMMLTRLLQMVRIISNHHVIFIIFLFFILRRYLYLGLHSVEYHDD